mmetsp:Transcript_21353/g.62241  ORF Transcript_21353/g.62241 Transcript_21353/m.62241 type:complete len:171 (-) Transcript_21353:3223-3735(-)
MEGTEEDEKLALSSELAPGTWRLFNSVNPSRILALMAVARPNDMSLLAGNTIRTTALDALAVFLVFHFKQSAPPLTLMVIRFAGEEDTSNTLDGIMVNIASMYGLCCLVQLWHGLISMHGNVSCENCSTQTLEPKLATLLFWGLPLFWYHVHENGSKPLRTSLAHGTFCP